MPCKRPPGPVIAGDEAADSKLVRAHHATGGYSKRNSGRSACRRGLRDGACISPNCSTASLMMKADSTTPWQTFPTETLDALFAAVEINDVVDRQVGLPAATAQSCTRDTLQTCFALCWQFWRRAVARRELVRLVDTAIRSGDLSAGERIQFKHMRAAYKQLRCALMLYATSHTQPLLFRATVGVLGQMQDASRLGRRMQVRGHGVVLRILLSWPFWNMTRKRVAATRIDTAEGCANFRGRELDQLRQLLQQSVFSGHEFHVMRKIVSRQVAFYDHLRTLESNACVHQMSRFLSAINGLMGARHDGMVRQHVSGARDYATREALPADIRTRLEAWLACFKA